MSDRSRLLGERLEFPFPAVEAPAGIPLSNGTFGAVILGEGRCIRIAVSRVEHGSCTGGAIGEERRGSVLPDPPRPPMGWLELELPARWRAASGGLHLATGEAEIELQDERRPAPPRGKLRASVLPGEPILCLRITGLDGAEVGVAGRPGRAPRVPKSPDSRELPGQLPRPQEFDLGEFGGWVQERPGAAAISASWLRHTSSGGLVLYFTSGYARNPVEARKESLRTLEAARGEGYTPATLRGFRAWQRWWSEAVEIPLPAAALDDLYQHAIRRLAGEAPAPAPGARTTGHGLAGVEPDAWGDPGREELLLPVGRISLSWPEERPDRQRWARTRPNLGRPVPLAVISIPGRVVWTGETAEEPSGCTGDRGPAQMPHRS